MFDLTIAFVAGGTVGMVIGATLGLRASWEREDGVQPGPTFDYTVECEEEVSPEDVREVAEAIAEAAWRAQHRWTDEGLREFRG